MRPPPLFSGGDQRSANPAAARVGHDEPPLEVRHAISVAPLGVRPDGELREAYRLSRGIHGEEDGERLGCLAAKEAIDLLAVLGFGAVGPEGVPQPEPRAGVVSPR